MRGYQAHLLLIALLLSGCVASLGVPPPAANTPSTAAGSTPAAYTTATPLRGSVTEGAASADVIPLPAPATVGVMTLEETLAQRRSLREYAGEALTLGETGQILWAAQGVSNEQGRRTAPSAGALYPLEVYAVTERATYRYLPDGHRLRVHLQGDRRPQLHQAALQQGPVLQAPLVIVITAVFERTSVKYGAQRTPRYVYMEAGHAGQNVLLQTVALGLGAVPIGAFYDDEVKKALALPDDEQPLYIIAVGRTR
jgi:SagB-type dehydrogenase family enzyme